jgi:DNA-binding HxlR family transcriptional regulator
MALEWLPAILVALTEGPRHYSELLEEADYLHLGSDWSSRHGRLHASTLTRALKQLTEDGLIERHESREGFITAVQYRLAPAAEDLLNAVTSITEWAYQHTELIERARQRRQGRGETSI